MSTSRQYIGRLIATGAARPVFWRCAIGLVLPLLAVLGTHSIFSLEQAPFFPLFSLAVVLGGIYGGRTSGFVATIASALLNAWVLPPRNSLRVTDLQNLERILAFVAVGFVLSILIGFLGEVQRKLDVERNRLHMTLASIGDCVICTDENGRVTFLNKVAEDTIAWTAAEAAAKPVEELFRLINERTRAAVADPVGRVLQSGRIVGLANHTLLLRRDGAEIPIDDSAAPICDLQGKLVGVVMVFRDITAQKQSQAALIRAEKLASVGRLAASIAHEVNNPLTAVSNILFLLGTAPDVGEDSRKLVLTAQEELRRAAHVTKHTLSFTRRAEEQEPVHISELVEEVLGFYSNKVNSGRIEIVKRYGDGAVARVAPSDARQVISNVIANALDALPVNGRLQLHIQRVHWPGKPRIRLTVADNGSGVLPEHHARMFEPFFSTKREMGAGLGLWMAKEIVERHDGCIHFRSRSGKGTVVVICWPERPQVMQQEASLA